MAATEILDTSECTRQCERVITKFHQMSYTKSGLLHAKRYSFARELISALIPADSCQGKEVTKEELDL
jgi:hypothetical protein